MKPNLRGKKVLLAMSGGVDSSVAAFLLQQKGAEVIGVYMRLFQAEGVAEEKARLVARKLGIKFLPINLVDKFKKEVVEYFLDSYASGETPNPCVKCNKRIKFGELFRMLDVVGADFFATGHYLKKHRLVDDEGFATYHLLRADDLEKDQSYFLYNLNQAQLSKTLFPLGEYQKFDIKRIAADNGLPNIKSESQDICFLQSDDKSVEHNIYLQKHIKLKKGSILDESGNKIGEHLGLPLYTVGQRKGVEVSGGPFYVASLDVNSNNLHVVKNRNDNRLMSTRLEAHSVNWLNEKNMNFPLNCQAVIRYHQKESACKVRQLENGRVLVIFQEPQWAVAPGQSIVFYNMDELLGGGIIMRNSQ